MRAQVMIFWAQHEKEGCAAQHGGGKSGAGRSDRSPPKIPRGTREDILTHSSFSVSFRSEGNGHAPQGGERRSLAVFARSLMARDCVQFLV